MDELVDRDQLIIDPHPVANGWALVLRGALDLATASALNHLARELEQVGCHRLVLDLRELSFVDCAGLGVVVAADLRARRAGGQVEVLCAPGQIERVLHLSGLDRHLSVCSQLNLARAGGDHTLAA